jgi:hypothetical protein
MPANWNTFRSNMKAKLGVPNQRTISELADIHATEYVNAVKSAQLVITSSKVTLGVNKASVKSAYEAAFNKLLNERTEISPNYKGDNPNPNQDKSREKIESIFAPVAAAITVEWAKEIFTPTTVPIGYVLPTTGYQVLVPGDPNALTKDLAKAFFIAQSEINQETAFNVFITALIAAYAEHLLKITGVFNGLIPVPPPAAPVPGPPFPWIGVV